MRRTRGKRKAGKVMRFREILDGRRREISGMRERDKKIDHLGQVD